MSNATRKETFWHPRTGTRYEFPQDAKRYVALADRIDDAPPCEYGHRDCAAWDRGPCSQQVLAWYVRDDEDQPEEDEKPAGLDPENPDTTIGVGDRVRSFDWPDLLDDPVRGSSYAEGVVEEILERGETVTRPHIETGEPVSTSFPDCDRYVLRVERRVFGGEEVDEADGAYVFPPVNGTPKGLSLDDAKVTWGVAKIGADVRSAVFGGDDSAAAFVAGVLVGAGLESVEMAPGEYHETVVSVALEEEAEARTIVEEKTSHTYR